MKFLLPALLVGVVHGAQRLDRPRTDGLTESNDASFGSSIVMSHGGDMVFVGEPGDPMLGGAGAVHAFQLSDDGATWSSSHTLEGDRSDGTNTQDSFGYSRGWIRHDGSRDRGAGSHHRPQRLPRESS